MKRLIKRVDAFFYHLETRLLLPVLLHYFPPRRGEPKKDVLHIGYLTTKPRIICGALRKKGVKADYLAFTHRFSNSSWLKTDDAGADYIVNPFLPLDCLGFFGEFRRLRGMLLNYKAVHCHFLRFSSVLGWELPILKSAGVRIVVHYRGCDIRFPEFYEKKQVECCACYECDYPDDYCSNSRKTELRRLASEYGDLFLVTTQ
ncbi:MAG: hypothetical protein GXP32_08590 [Kiritimatiellaeota bacterium]|nr:hypothetical protein [Kiritimatiellota bacterium]